MSYKPAYPNRREAMKMLFATAAGATIAGGGTYLQMDDYQSVCAKLEAEDMVASGQYDSLTKKQILDILEPYYKRNVGKMAIMAGAFGAVVGSYHYDWTTPDVKDDFDFYY